MAVPENMLPQCPKCDGDITGLNISGMKLPVPGPDGRPAKFLVFMIPCCPHCNVVLSVHFSGEEAAPPPGAAAGLWVPPGAKC